MSEDIPHVDVWHDEGRVSLVIRDASIIEQGGVLVPGVALSPIAALKLIENILSDVQLAMIWEAEED